MKWLQWGPHPCPGPGHTPLEPRVGLSRAHPSRFICASPLCIMSSCVQLRAFRGQMAAASNTHQQQKSHALDIRRSVVDCTIVHWKYNGNTVGIQWKYTCGTHVVHRLYTVCTQFVHQLVQKCTSCGGQLVQKCTSPSKRKKKLIFLATKSDTFNCEFD